MVSVLVGIVVVAVVAAVVIVGAAWFFAKRRSRAPRLPAIDPFTLSEPWRRHVAAAQSAQRRYTQIARATPEGPLRERLTHIDVQVHHAVHECFGIARRGDELDDALKRFSVSSLTSQLQAATDPVAVASLQSQLDAANRIRSTRDDTDAQLRLLTTRMGELVAQAAEVSVGTDSTEQLGSGVGDVVTQLEALRLALNEVNNTGRPASSP